MAALIGRPPVEIFILDYFIFLYLIVKYHNRANLRNITDSEGAGMPIRKDDTDEATDLTVEETALLARDRVDDPKPSPKPGPPRYTRLYTAGGVQRRSQQDLGDT